MKPHGTRNTWLGFARCRAWSVDQLCGSKRPTPALTGWARNPPTTRRYRSAQSITGPESYHKLGPRKFSAIHNLDIRAIVSRLNLKPLVRLEAGCFVAHLEGKRYVLGKIRNGFPPALRRMREVCGRERMAVGHAS